MASGDVRYGPTGTYNQTVGVKLDMDDAIAMLTPTDVPLQRRLASESTSSIKVEWLEEDLMAQAVTATVVAGAGTPWTVTIAAAEGDPIRPGDVLHTKDAAAGVQFLVTSIDTSAHTFVAAAFAGNATAPVAADVLEIVGQYRVEGGDPEVARSKERYNKFNYTQIGEEKVEVTRTGRKQALYGVGDKYDHEVSKKFKELAIRFEKSLVLGQRAISGDSKQRFMGGLLYFITTNSVSGVKANAGTLVNDALRKSFDAGGTPQTLMVSPSVKRAISDNIDPSARRKDYRDSQGGYTIDSYMSDFGEVEIVINRFFPKTKGITLQEEFLKRKVFDGYAHELLAKTGDSDKGHIVGEFSLEVKNDPAHCVLTITDA